MNRATAVLFALLVVIFAVVAVENRGAFSAKPATAPPSEFSAERARAALRTILGGNVPHPVGSAAHDAVRDRLVAHLQSLGYDVTLQRAFACTANVVCAPVVNVMARMPGDNRPDALLIAAHYDSVPAGPGASDDGEGVATIVETARALRNEHFRSGIIFLITDAEEAGLIGAEGFTADPMWDGFSNPSVGAGGRVREPVPHVAAVINLDARGTTGPSYLFETSSRNEWLVRLFARALPRPATTSVFYSVYEKLPNDTDMTVFRRAGMAGVNFGNIGGVARYHTPLDNLGHVDPGTLQHHGEHLLAMARALGNSDLRQTSDGDAVWFDVFSLFIIWWPQSWSLWMAIVALIIVLVAVVLRFHDRAMPGGGATVGVMSFFLSALAAFIVGIAAAWLAGLRAHGEVFVAQPGPAIAAMWLIGACAAIALAGRFHDSAAFDGLYLGQAISWSAIAITLAFLLPGASYLAVVPAVVAAVLAAGRATVGASEAVVSIVSAVAAAITFFPLLGSLYVALGRPVLPAIAAVVAMVSATFAPLLAAVPWLRRTLVSGFAVTAIVFITIANLIPTWSAESPRHINIRYLDDGQPQWLTDTMTRPIARAASFRAAPRRVFEWLSTPPRAYAAPAPGGLPAPEVRVLHDEGGPGTRHLVLQMRSARNAQRIALFFRTSHLRSIGVNGVTPPPPPQRFRNFFAPDWHQAAVRGAAEAEIDIVLGRDERLDAVVMDTSYGLPPDGAALLRARDTSLAVPVQDGDTTTVLRRLRL